MGKILVINIFLPRSSYICKRLEDCMKKLILTMMFILLTLGQGDAFVYVRGSISLEDLMKMNL